MTLCWSKNDNPRVPRDRELPRNCGQLLGQLDELLPFIYIAQYGASDHDLGAHATDVATGLFAVGKQTGGDRPGVAFRVGLVLPVHRCRDEKVRTTLLEIPALVNGTKNSTLSDRRYAVQAKLDSAFDGELMIEDREDLDGFFALKPGSGLFKRLHESFDYVISVLDNPAGAVHVTETSTFHWQSYGELMDWYHGLRGPSRFGTWSPLTPFYVCDDTGALHSYSTDRWGRQGLIKPAEEPSKWFVIRPGLPNANPVVRFEMEEYVWAKLHLTLDAVTVSIRLSDVFDPFPELVAWGREIDGGDLPIGMEIDEEGQIAELSVLRTENPARVLLRVARDHGEDILLEGIVDRATLASALKSE
ncbi:MAG: hypothetical protein KDI30_08040, partial [Pseudomonadales bacterium]|nr:hypothetical protein [Pseudomonadales bacterium]